MAKRGHTTAHWHVFSWLPATLPIVKRRTQKPIPTQPPPSPPPPQKYTHTHTNICINIIIIILWSDNDKNQSLNTAYNKIEFNGNIADELARLTNVYLWPGLTWLNFNLMDLFGAGCKEEGAWPAVTEMESSSLHNRQRLCSLSLPIQSNIVHWQLFFVFLFLFLFFFFFFFFFSFFYFPLQQITKWPH